MKKETEKKKKKIGQVFTPDYIVDEILDYCGYIGDNIPDKHLIDNSCGDGAFLVKAVDRYCKQATALGFGLSRIKSDLEKYIHGIDTDNVAFEKCKENLNAIAKIYGIENVQWDLYNQSSLSMKKFDGQMDYVVGNPPYVRVHNLDSTYDEVKQFVFANGGMTDLYLVFFELGFNMLSETGKLCYITPSSWLNSLAAENMRNYICRKKNLVSLTDLGHFQAFENATTYTIISLFEKGKCDHSFDYYRFNGSTLKREFVSNITLEECLIDNYFYLSNSENLSLLKNIKSKPAIKYVTVKNGFATLADNVFIGSQIPDSTITIPVLKASTGKWSKCLFPYDTKGKLLPREKVFSEVEVAEYFELHKQELLKDKPEYPSYYEYGRTQALLDVWRDKVAINTLLRTENDLKIEEVKYGSGLYSGLYIITDYDITIMDIKDILISRNFAEYISLLKKYKSGGYYTFNSKDVEQYINYYITFNSKKKYVNQSNVSDQNLGVF